MALVQMVQILMFRQNIYEGWNSVESVTAFKLEPSPFPTVFQVEKRELEVHTRTLSPWNHKYFRSRNATLANDYHNKWSQILDTFHTAKKETPTTI